MMKRFLLAAACGLVIVGLIGHCNSSSAQQPPADPKIETYKFLLNEANERVAQSNAAIGALQAEVASLKAQIEKRKAEDAEAAKAAPKK